MESDKLEALAREVLADEVERMNRPITAKGIREGWTGDYMEAAAIRAMLRFAALTPPVDGGEFVMVPREADGWTQYERGIQAAEMWLRDQQHKLPPETLWHAAAILADRMNVELLPASPSRTSPSPEQRYAMKRAIEAEMDRQVGIGAGMFATDPETGLWQINADFDPASMIDAVFAALTTPTRPT